MTTTLQPPAPTRASSVAAVELAGVTKRFGDLTAVADISLRIQPGEIVALLGPNGAGKTSTIDMLLGFSEPTAGSVRIHGAKPQEAVALGRVSAALVTAILITETESLG